jgi:AmmeMemoRadiSam system protein A
MADSAGPADAAGADDSELTPQEGRELAGVAARAVAAKLCGVAVDGRPPAQPRLRALGASFVTLEAAGHLRGCIGSLYPARPLYLDVVRNARRAAEDPRLPPVTAAEWSRLDISVSVLTLPRPLAAAGPAELAAALRPGLDGLILQDGRRRATFLPKVWHKLPDPADFVQALLDKGGWPARGWPAGIRAARYTSVDFTDTAPRPALSSVPSLE